VHRQPVVCGRRGSAQVDSCNRTWGGHARDAGAPARTRRQVFDRLAPKSRSSPIARAGAAVAALGRVTVVAQRAMLLSGLSRAADPSTKALHLQGLSIPSRGFETVVAVGRVARRRAKSESRSGRPPRAPHRSGPDMERCRRGPTVPLRAPVRLRAAAGCRPSARYIERTSLRGCSGSRRPVLAGRSALMGARLVPRTVLRASQNDGIPLHERDP
jgi:hypothetical protein